LATRLLSLTPNGIDRIDFALANHFFEDAGTERFGVLLTPLGPRLFAASAARSALKAIGLHWGEDKDPQQDPAYLRVVAALATGASNKASADFAPRVSEGRTGRLAATLQWLSQHGIPIGPSLRKALPNSVRYINVSQFPIWNSAYLGWLEKRRDVKSIFFIHDLLPIEMPEYFRFGEQERHRRRLANVARFGTAIIVASEFVREGVADYMRDLGRVDLPILVAPVPSAPIFGAPMSDATALAAPPYFVCCGTIEPRKNHMLLLEVWRELVRQDKEAAPKLVLVGVRGWKNAAVVNLLEHNPALRSHVIEVAGLTSPALQCLLAGARGLLMPSFAEGYGLPVREALTTGISVVASDIPAFREIKDERLTLLSPNDGETWLAAVRYLAGAQGRKNVKASDTTAGWKAFFEKTDAFVAAV
jgi:glycosyltransferase involved in cell wall biosynthesis